MCVMCVCMRVCMHAFMCACVRVCVCIILTSVAWDYCQLINWNRLDQIFSDAFARDYQLIKADPKHSL